MSIRKSQLVVLFKPFMSLLILCLLLSMAEKRVFKSPIISLYLSIKFTDSLFGKPANEPTESTLPLQHLVSVCVCVCVCV